MSDIIMLAEAKAQCRVTSSDEDTYIEALIASAIRYVEMNLSVTLEQRSLTLFQDAFTPVIYLPRGPVDSVTSVAYTDPAGQPQVVPPTTYTLDKQTRPASIVLNNGESWPQAINGPNAVRVIYVAGFTSMPVDWLDVKHAILLLIGHWFNMRESVAVGTTVTEVPLAVDALLLNRRWVVA